MRSFLIAGALAGVATLAAAATQTPHSSEDGLGWDGAQYVRLTEQCWQAPLEALEPFVYRIGAPCVAALLPLPPAAALAVVNSAAAILLLLLLHAWLRRHVSPAVTTWLLAGFAFHWLAPLRSVWWYPTHIDPVALCAIVAILLLGARPWAFIVACLAGGLVRETVLVVPLALAAGRILAVARPPGAVSGAAAVARDGAVRTALAGIAFGLLGALLPRLLVTPASDYWMADAAFYWAFHKPLPAYLLAWFITFGPALVLLAVRPLAVRRFFGEFPAGVFFVAAVAGLAWIGGSDTERFLLWASPIVLVAIGRAADAIAWRAAIAPLVVLVLAQAVSGRWFLTTPDYGQEAPRVWPVLTPWTADGVELLLSQTPYLVTIAVALTQYLLLSLVLWLWLAPRRAA